MKRVVSLILFSLLCACALPAQTFNLITGRVPVTSLDGLWRFHTGDNPAWANPEFDDSQWPVLRSDQDWGEQGYKGYSGFAWYRFQIVVPAGGKPVSLLLSNINTGYQVYANGTLIGSAGSPVETHNPVVSAPPTMFRLPVGGTGLQTVQISLRVWDYKPYSVFAGGGPLGPGCVVGDPVLLQQQLHWYGDASAVKFVNMYTYALLATMVGITILGLFLFRPEDREYLWFAILLLAAAVDPVVRIAVHVYPIPLPPVDMLAMISESVAAIAALAFFSIVLKMARSSLWWIAVLAAAVSPLTMILYYFQWTPMGIVYAIQLCCLLPAYFWIVGALTMGAIRKDIAARLLFVPATLFYGYAIFSDMVFISSALGWQRRLLSLEIPIFQKPFPLDPEDVINYVFVLALLIFLVRRFSLARQKEARLSAELEAARGMQSLLVPVTPPVTPGFTVESVYFPASEVGGDFFQILPADDGSLLIVVGDVSGKGLKAAMTVSTIVGALRNEASRQPARVLANLNRVLHGQITGFATCCAALIRADGVMTIANAGHIPPYRNGEEMAVQGGLPLGIVEAGNYEETRFEIAPGDRLTFVSDGVVEATNVTRELFGFARTQAISREPAQTIAEAAKSFGQEDDISVLSVTRIDALRTVHA